MSPLGGPPHREVHSTSPNRRPDDQPSPIHPITLARHTIPLGMLLPRRLLGHIPRRPRHTINSLRRFADNVCWLAGWIAPDIPTYIQNSDHWWSLQALLNRQALVTYRQLGGKIGTYRAILAATELPQRSKEKPTKPRFKFLERVMADRYFY